MKFSDQGIIINIKNYGENSAIVKILTQDHGIYCGFIKSIKSSKTKAIFQIGNFISFEYKTRLEENLGQFSRPDLITSYCAKILFDKEKLNLSNALFHLIDNVILEKFQIDDLFNYVQDFLQNLTIQDDHLSNLKNFIILEFNILRFLGYEIDISSCAATGVTTNLEYVSPKSARAVCQESGQPYASKLLKLPQFLLNNCLNANNEDLKNGLKLTEFFLLKFIFDGDKSKLRNINFNF